MIVSKFYNERVEMRHGKCLDVTLENSQVYDYLTIEVGVIHDDNLMILFGQSYWLPVGYSH